MDDLEFTQIVKEALKEYENIIANPDVIHTEIYRLMNRLAAYAGRISILALDMDKAKASEAKVVIKGINDLVGTLKYQAKEQLNQQYFSNR